MWESILSTCTGCILSALGNFFIFITFFFFCYNQNFFLLMLLIVCSVFIMFSCVCVCCRLVFWTDWGSNPKIEIGHMDGSHRQSVVTDVVWPNGLAIDREIKRLYWVDAGYSTLESCDFNGQSRVAIMQSSLSFPFGIVFFSGFVFWSDWNLGSLFRARVGDEHSFTVIQHFPLTRIMQPIVISTRQPREGGK